MKVEYEDTKKDTKALDRKTRMLFYRMLGSYEYDINHAKEIDYEHLGHQFERRLNEVLEEGLMERVVTD